MRAVLCSCLLLLLIAPAHAEQYVSAHLTGRVADAAGKPLPGATVLFNRANAAKMELNPLPHATTDSEGKYELTLRFADERIILREVFAEMKGYARAAREVEIPLRGGDTATLDFTLKEGELLAGVIRLPLTAAERLAGQKPEQIQRIIEVIGPPLGGVPMNGRCYRTEPGGRFEIYLPAGEYTLRVLGYDAEPPPEWSGIRPAQPNLILDLPPFEWSEAEIGKVFDQWWQGMDRHYSYFLLKKDVDWDALKAQYRPRAISATSAKELAAVLQEMLAPLRDLHVWIQTPDGGLPTHRSTWQYNGNSRVTLDRLHQRTDCGRFAIVGRTRGDGFGCFLMANQSQANSDNVKQAAQAIRGLADAPGFIVDLRRANGGNELLALEIARLFCSEDTIYAKSKYRNGPGHQDFTQNYDRILPASPDPYTRPIVCLIGPGAVSSGEAFVKMMQCLPHVTTVGLPTRGASGNPRPWELPGTGITVFFSRWVDMMPDGRPFEGIGILPEVEVDEPAEAYADRDPTLEKGLEILRRKVAAKPPAD